ncbi:GntR family transcriptional regulator [Advenella kashmirensis W13003]|uniref:GntR family transcriptional regulator n=1 Tax=Advenella kashmirensis W13003 TaxID=1424334 RepID=V8QVT3_9BURK|nr:GntR family transcriptional regulator [Advenella kashmirensis]ETF03762.1 GntR family transcriptional regulator [Advenella kashmirensis W13003]
MDKELKPVYRPVKTPRAFENVCDQIRAQLESGALQHGDKLPPERELAERFGVSRNVLREALRSLEIAGLISLKKGGTGGSFITGGDPKIVSRAFKDVLVTGGMTLSEFTEARILILNDIIRLACDRATEEDFVALEENIERTDEFTQSGDAKGRLELAEDFYRLLAAAGKNKVLGVSIDALTEILMQFLASADKPHISLLIDSRKQFMKHLRARDAAKASKAMTTYLAGLHQHLLTASARKSTLAQKRAKSS